MTLGNLRKSKSISAARNRSNLGTETEDIATVRSYE